MEFDSSSPNPIPSYQSTSEDALISLLDQSKDVNDAHSMYQLMLVEGSQKLGGRFSEDVKLEKGLLTSLKKVSLGLSGLETSKNASVFVRGMGNSTKSSGGVRVRTAADKVVRTSSSTIVAPENHLFDYVICHRSK